MHRAIACLTGLLLTTAPLMAQSANGSASATPQQPVAHPQAQPSALNGPLRVMRDYRGVRLGMKAEDVYALLGKPDNSDQKQRWDEFRPEKKLLITAYYDTQGLVGYSALFH